MRIVFMGTPEFAVPSLQVLLQEYEVAAVVTQPDRRSGRGKRYRFSPIKEVALSAAVPILQPEKIDDPRVLEQLEGYGADLFVVVAFGQKLPGDLLTMPVYGCINVHSSLLPKYRGASPINTAIVQGDSVTGVTTMYMDSGWDTGDLVLQAEEPILLQDTAGSLHDRLAVLGSKLLHETVRQIDLGIAPRVPQVEQEATFAFKLAKEDAQVGFNRPARELDYLIRGMNPWPLAYTVIGDEVVKILQASPQETTGIPGEILSLDQKGLLVGCRSGSLLLEKLQRPNARAVSGVDFANGLRLRVGDILN